MWPISSDFRAYAKPSVPADLIRYTCGTDSFEEFLRSGFETATMFNLALRKYTGKLFSDFQRILDFGTGCGRMVRHIEPKGALFGCDVNRLVVDYCKSSFRHASFYRNDLMPPLIYREGLFDLVYSFSVFSHLRLDVEDAWLRELARVGAPGCVYLITIQGDWMIEATLGTEAAEAQAKGFYYKSVHQRHGSEADFPDYYESSYHTATYVKKEWARHFEILAVIKGDDPGRYLSGALQFAPHGTVPLLRPMGQDLVVAVKR